MSISDEQHVPAHQQQDSAEADWWQEEEHDWDWVVSSDPGENQGKNLYALKATALFIFIIFEG